ncbi:Endonuclease/exonuclease/phosphatase [Lactarius deliciosus]|nr:Endonuclease/exonuclease/phosphatase [Lactarius deliciosus]
MNDPPSQLPTDEPEANGRHHAVPQCEHHNNTLGCNTNGPAHIEQRQNTSDPINPPLRMQSKKGLRKRANIKIGTLNVNSLCTSTEYQLNLTKWAEINTTMKKEKIVVLAVQETHLDEQSTHDIHRALGKCLIVINSQLDDNPKSSAGVAFVINKDLIDAERIDKYELIKGRVIAINLTWKEETLLISVYALNNRRKNQRFWETVNHKRLSKHLRKPDFVLGNFNLTEEPINRSLPKHDNAGAKNVLRDFRIATDILDQWRHTYPKVREFTYHATTNRGPIKSCLDRIYIAKERSKFTFDWSIKPSSVPTDHWLVMVKYAPKNSPYLGKGKRAKLQEDIKQINPRTDPNNAQLLWHKFKLSTITRLDYEAKKANYKYQSKILNLEKDRKETLDNPDFEENADLQWQEAILTNEINYLKRKSSHNKREHLKVKISHHGKKLGGTWSNLTMRKDQTKWPKLQNNTMITYKTQTSKTYPSKTLTRISKTS